MIITLRTFLMMIYANLLFTTNVDVLFRKKNYKKLKKSICKSLNLKKYLQKVGLKKCLEFFCSSFF